MYTCEVIEDPMNEGEYLIELPEGLLAELNWVEGDDLIWSIEENGKVSLRRKE